MVVQTKPDPTGKLIKRKGNFNWHVIKRLERRAWIECRKIVKPYLRVQDGQRGISLYSVWSRNLPMLKI